MRHFLFSLLLSSAALASGSAFPEGAFYGSIIYNSKWTQENAPYGIYSFSAETWSEPEALFLAPEAKADGGGVYRDGKYYAYRITEMVGYVAGLEQYVYDTASWQLVSSTALPDLSCRSYDLACDYNSGMVYGSFMDSQNNNAPMWGILDPETNEVTIIRRNLDFKIWGVAINRDSECFVISNYGELYRMTKETGETEFVGNTGLFSRYCTSMMFDQVSGKLYYLPNSDNESALYEIDTATAKAEKIYDLPDDMQVQGGYFLPYAADAKAPAAPSEFACLFAEDALSGEISFRVPNTLYDGSPASGALEYRIYAGNELLASGSASCGDAVTEKVTVAESAFYSFRAYCSNERGDGAKAVKSLWVGQDTLSPMESPLLAISDDGSEYVISWKQPEAAHGGYIDYGDVTYKIVDWYTKAEMASGIRSTSFAIAASESDALENLRYGVIAAYRGKSLPAVATNKIVAGREQLPYDNDFATEDAIEYFTFIDHNADDCCWEYGVTAWRPTLRYELSLQGPADDYAVLPPFFFRKGHKYNVTVEAFCGDTAHPERLGIVCGKRPMAEDFIQELLPATLVEEGFTYNSSGTSTLTGTQLLSGEFVPEEDGIRYVALHCTSDFLQRTLNLMRVQVSEDTGGTKGLESASESSLSVYRLDGTLVVKGAEKVPQNLPEGLYIIVSPSGVEKIRKY